ncbi:hypothetical protein SCHIN_v1c01450 [Spiroplasma chinense]|uniref:Uncharacterized protein n=1 Tax=Spiroplasma chinense TaxID=216932 RepID=A0A5B9Y3K6_9MOLU|nr:hypothetical protein [Spiroplasma chinense]QEH61343.1 hypothetical protein SCHIN_v1c01450 [Spiroplasma chinense]
MKKLLSTWRVLTWISSSFRMFTNRIISKNKLWSEKNIFIKDPVNNNQKIKDKAFLKVASLTYAKMETF